MAQKPCKKTPATKRRRIMTGEDRDALQRLGISAVVAVVGYLLVHFFVPPRWQTAIFVMVGGSITAWLVCHAAEESLSGAPEHHFYGICKRIIEGFWRIAITVGGGIALLVFGAEFLLDLLTGAIPIKDLAIKILKFVVGAIFFTLFIVLPCVWVVNSCQEERGE